MLKIWLSLAIVVAVVVNIVALNVHTRALHIERKTLNDSKANKYM